jgi:hypothetical protein
LLADAGVDPDGSTTAKMASDTTIVSGFTANLFFIASSP